MRIRGLGRSPLTALAIAALVVGGTARTNDRADFETMMDEAIKRMHAEMHIHITGDADRDFARMMIPHHQGAIDMALVEIRYGKDARLRRLAQEIIVTQQQEIAVMHLALGDPVPPGRPAATQLLPAAEVHHDR